MSVREREREHEVIYLHSQKFTELKFCSSDDNRFLTASYFVERINT